MKKYIAAVAFLSCLPLANLMIQNVGTTCIPKGPCLIPVGFGLMAPSGVLLIGAALLLRDAVHEAWGRLAAFWLVVAGAVASVPFVAGHLLTASLLAFLLSEMADFFVYDRLRKNKHAAAVFLSGLVGATADTALFSYVAFGTLAWQPGLLLGKMYASTAVALFLLYKQRNNIRIAS